MRWEGERLGLPTGLKGEGTAGADVPFAIPAPLQENSGGYPAQCFHKLGRSGLPQSSHRDSSGSVGAGTSCLRELSSDVTVLTSLYPTWGCLHLGFHHMEDAGLLLLPTARAAVCPHRGGGWCHSGAGAQLGCGNLSRAQQEQPPGALPQPGTETSAGLVPLLLALLWPRAINRPITPNMTRLCVFLPVNRGERVSPSDFPHPKPLGAC